MDQDKVISFDNLELFEDPLTDLIRNGFRQLIALAVEAEVNELMAKYDGQHTETGHRAVVQSGYQRQRQIQTGIGAMMVKVPKARSTSGAPVSPAVGVGQGVSRHSFGNSEVIKLAQLGA